jgi:hypothetical protein
MRKIAGYLGAVMLLGLILCPLLNTIDINQTTMSKSDIWSQNCEKISPNQPIFEESVLPAGETLLYTEFPTVDKQAFSPASSPGFMDEILISGKPAKNLNYTYEVDAIPRSFNIPNTIQPSILLAPIANKLMIFFVKNVIAAPFSNHSIQMMESSDHGETWSTPRNITPVLMVDAESNTYASPIAVEGPSAIHLIYRFNSSYIYYINSTNGGSTWSTPRVIQNGTINFREEDYSRIDMAFDPLANILHVAAATCSGSDENNDGIYFFNSTNGGDSWSVPARIPLLGSGAYSHPSLSFNSTGAVFLTALNYTTFGYGTGFVSIFPDGLWEPASTFVKTGIYGSILSCIDVTTDSFILCNQTIDVQEMWRSSNVEGDIYTKITDGPQSLMGLMYGSIVSRGNLPYYCNRDYLSGINTVVFLHVTEPLDIVRSAGTVDFGSNLGLKFDGKNDGRHGTDLSGYRDFTIHLDSFNGSDHYNYYAYVYRDDNAPKLGNITFNPYISPAINDGVLDFLNLNFTVDEECEYAYKIIQEVPRSIGTSTISASLFSKTNPEIIMDESGRFFAFYQIKSGMNYQLFYHISNNGGITWSTAKALTLSGYDNEMYSVHVDKAGIYIFTTYLPYSTRAILRSVDGGETWTVTYAPDNLVSELICVSPMGVIYAIMESGLPDDVYLYNSLDGGQTWNPVYNLPGDLGRYEKMALDHQNGNLYFIYDNSIEKNYEFLIYNEQTMVWSNITLFANAPNDYRALIHEFKLVAATDIYGETQIELKIIQTPDFHDIYKETWLSVNNGTTWVKTNTIPLSEFTFIPTGEFFHAETNTSLICTVEMIEGVDNVILRGSSGIIYRDSGRATRGQFESIAYNGKDFNSQYLPHGDYNILLTAWDLAKNTNETILEFSIDNQAPIIFDINWTTPPAHPLPQQNATITFNAVDGQNHLQKVEVWYKHSNTGWINSSVIHLGGSLYRANFTGNNTSSQLEFYIKAFDWAGNVQIENNNELLYGWKDPTINAVVLLLSEKRTTFDEIPVSVVFTQGVSYVVNVSILTSFGENVLCGWQGDNYYGLIPNAPKLEFFTYNIVYTDVYNRSVVVYQNTHFRPFISIAKLEIPTVNMEFTSTDRINFTVDFSSDYVAYILDVKVVYRLNGGEWVNHSFILKENTGSFQVSIGPFPNAQKIEFYLVYEDMAGEHVIEGTTMEFIIIPAMPEIQLTAQQSLIIVIIAAIVGLIVGVGYGLLLRSQLRDPIMTYSDAFRASKSLGENERPPNPDSLGSRDLTSAKKRTSQSTPFGILTTPLLQYQPPPIKKSGVYTLMAVLLAIGAGIYYFFMLGKYENAAALAALGSIFITFFFELLLEIASESAIRDRAKLANARIASLLFLVGTFCAIVLVFWIGSKITWFNYYMFEDHLSLGGYPIPTIWLSVAATYFTSMLLVVFTTQSSIKNYYPALNTRVQEGAGLYDVFLFREHQIITTKQQLMYKTLGFIAFVVISIIIATNLSHYMNLGLILLLPFLLGCLIGMIVSGKSRRKQSRLSKIQMKTHCGKCGTETLHGSYCNNCGQPLVLGVIELEHFVDCPLCASLNPKESLFCRICGTSLPKS